MATPERSPGRLYYTIGEVCEMFDIKPHVLRYWETVFHCLRPAKNRAGNRVYRSKDLRVIRLIKYLLHEEGYTIEGADRKLQKLLHALGQSQTELPLEPPPTQVLLDEVRATLLEIRSMLAEIPNGSQPQG